MVDVVKLKGLAAAQKEKREAGARQTQATNRIKSKLFGASTTPYVTTGPVGQDSAGYSICKALSYASRRSGPENCKEELAVSEKLKRFYGSNVRTEPNSILLLGSSNPMYFPEEVRFDSEGLKFLAEVREKMLASVGKADPDEIKFLREKQKAIGTFPATAGGSLIPPPMLMSELIDLQRNAQVFSQVGAREVPLSPQGANTWARQTGASTAYWVGEASAITESQPTTGSLELRAKKLGVIVTIDQEALLFSNPSAEAMVRQDMAEVAALKADLAFLEGTGGTQPRGLITYTGDSNSYLNVISYTASTVGANGNTLEPQDIVKMIGKLPDAVRFKELKWVMHPNLWAAMGARRNDAVSANDAKGAFTLSTMRTNDQTFGTYLEGKPVITSQQVSTTRVKNAGTDLTYSLLGHWPEWLIGRYGVVEVLMNPYSATPYANVQTQLRAVMYIDAGPRTPNSFVFCDQLLQS